MSHLPQDPFMLLSFINMHQLDDAVTLDELCKTLDVDKDEIISKLSAARFTYVPEINQFR